ncbi:hypothetical protein HK096_006458 [Nowakowskiella sp. JEL0078]|nr:hypothetical protein HK096_006458 [Nowakowskiella sp. JEL0078]
MVKRAKLRNCVMEIYEQILKLGFTDCKVLVSNVDSQTSLSGGIIVQVLGELSNHGLPCHKFAQTFFLAEQPNGYYVRNDIFRFLKEDIDNDYENTLEPTAEPLVREYIVTPVYEDLSAVVATPEPITAEHIVKETPVVVIEPVQTAQPVQSITLSQSIRKEVITEPSVTTSKLKDPVIEKKPTPNVATTNSIAEIVQSSAHTAPKKSAHGNNSPTKQIKSQKPVHDQTPQQTTQNRPTTWASLAATGKDAWGNQASPVKSQTAPVSPTLKQSTVSNKSTAPITPTSTPVSQSPLTTDESQDGSNRSSEAVFGDEVKENQFQTIPARSTRQQNRNSYNNGYQNNGGYQNGYQHNKNSQIDGYSVFIANIPTTSTQEEVKALFGKSGPISNIEFHRTKNIAFVEFTNLEGMQKALSQPNIVNGITLQVQEKRKIPKYQGKNDYKDREYDSRNNNGYIRGGSRSGSSGRGRGHGDQRQKERPQSGEVGKPPRQVPPKSI